MLRLDTTTRKLQALLGGAITTNQLPITVCYSDKTSTAYTGGTTVINTNNTTAVDICAAPAASTVRDIDTINVNNADTVAATITIRYNDNGTTYTLFKATLATGDQLTYVHGVGWNVIDSTGKTKVGAGVNGPGSSTDNALVRWDGTAGTAIQNSGWTLSDTDALNGVSGSVGAPSLTLNGETTSGLYRIGANNHGWAISGAKVLDIASTGLAVTGTGTFTGTSTSTITNDASSGATITTFGNRESRILGLSSGGVGAVGAGAELVFGLVDTNTKRFASVSGYVEATDGTGAAGGISITAKGTAAATALSEVARFTSTGLAVTGTLSASGGITNTAAASTNSSLTLSGSGAYSSVVTLNGAGGGSGQVTAGSGASIYLNAPTGQHVYQSINYTTVTDVSSTGLAVTGTLSATGTLSGGTGGTGYSFSGSAAAGSLALDASGNLGLGVTPSAWQTTSYRVVELPGGVSLFGQTDARSAWLTNNAYLNSSYQWIYKYSDYATYYRQYAGAHSWYTAPSGTAGNAITFTERMSLTEAGSFTLATAGPHAIGGATNADHQLYLTGSFTGAGTNSGAFGIVSTLTGPVNGTAVGLNISPTLNKAGSGTHSDFIGTYMAVPTIGAGAATITNASTLKIAGAPTGATNNYSLWVAGTGTTRIESTTFNVTGTGPHAIGGATATNSQFRVTGTYTPGASDALGFVIDGTQVPGAGSNAANLYVGGALTEAGSGTHSIFAGIYATAPIINAGAASLTNAATIYITGAPTGATNNYSLWCSGNTRWDSGYLKAASATTYVSLSGNYHELNQSNDSGVPALQLVHRSATATNQYGAVIALTGDPNDATRYFLQCVGNATERATIRSNGGLANYSANDVNLSDATVKRDKGATADHTNFVKALSYRKFSYLDDQTDSDVDGLMAQDVQALDPTLVTEFSEGKLGIYTHRLQERINSIIPKLIQRIEALESQLQ